MDAHAYLRKQGWRGAGHALDHHGRGIKKPLLIAHKRDQLGLGKKKAAHSVDDQWWMRAFDESLQSIGTGQESTLSQIRSKGINRGGLYGFFVKGEGLAGTISSTETSSSAEASGSSTPSSGASTPATSDDERSLNTSEDVGCAADPFALSKKNNKRKRGKEEKRVTPKKAKLEQLVIGALGAFDATQVKGINATIQNLKRQVTATLKANEKKGDYGLYISRKELESKKKGKPIQLCDDSKSPDRRVAYKEAKTQRREAMQRARRDMMKQHVVAAMLKGDLPNPKGWTNDEAIANYPDIASALKAIKAIKKARKKAHRVENNMEEAAKKAAKKARKEAKNGRQAENKTAAGRAGEIEEQDDEADHLHHRVASLLDELSPGQKLYHAKRAAKRKKTLEEYVQSREEKKLAKRMRRIAKEGSDPILVDTASVDPAPSTVFVADLEGDTGFARKVKNEASKAEEDVVRKETRKLAKKEKRERTGKGCPQEPEKKKDRHLASENAKATKKAAKKAAAANTAVVAA